jgi:hypothetical protein
MLERAERIRCCGNALAESQMDGFSLIDDGSAARARRFREKAEEIRRAARLANSLDIVGICSKPPFILTTWQPASRNTVEPVRIASAVRVARLDPPWLWTKNHHPTSERRT